ncbi:brefeldin A-inhibited guanine nucleotide-exchange protein 2-like [Diaphorina citri]|uniref:Brefeldin A-inhibited guanine nucleotide-exchange protein 2-like n=1 Tax=Diaphorina citri TaxID=121845 RepID=A0A3Q0JB10_DIACI|nr:brefeldin A-inhibited guanine nucleotide-exchange protein 2-like [Diaphorina citri]
MSDDKHKSFVVPSGHPLRRYNTDEYDFDEEEDLDESDEGSVRSGNGGLSSILSSFSLRFRDDKTLAVTVPPVKPFLKKCIFLNQNLYFLPPGYNYKEKPNLLAQETQSLACVLRILFKMATSEQMRPSWGSIEQQLIGVNQEALQYFLSLQYEMHRDAWTSLLLLILTKILKMSDDKFRVHTSAYYTHLCDLMCFDLKPELRSVLRKYFLRLGTVYAVL